MFKYSDSNKRYHTLDYFYKHKFGCKIAKISLNGGFTCPNKDGTKGVGGCIYCSKLGSGDYAGKPNKSLTEQFFDIKRIIELVFLIGIATTAIFIELPRILSILFSTSVNETK